MIDEPVDSPCIKVCVVDLDTGHCIGCGRSKLEIAGWPHLNTGDKRDIVARLPDRLSEMTTRRRRKGGRRGRRSE